MCRLCNQLLQTHPREDVLVPPELHARHLDTQDALALGRQTLDDISLEPTEHDVLELIVQLADLGLLVLIGQVEVLLEKGVLLGLKEMHQSQKLYTALQGAITIEPSVCAPTILMARRAQGKAEPNPPFTLFCRGVPVISNLAAVENE